MLSTWIKKTHIYLGLLNFTILLVFGIAGLVGTFKLPPGHQRPLSEPEYLEFHAPANASDYETALTALRSLRFEITDPLRKDAVRRDAEYNVTFDVHNINGLRKVTVLERENRVRIVESRASLGQFLSALHSTVAVHDHTNDLRIRLWTWYTEFSVWSLLVMAVSGVYLWLSSRSNFRWAQVSFLAGGGAFLMLYALTR